ncbi:hypothetical protein GQX50_00990, partial [Staphylococcus aureus]|nr:hypothetical protein [Staphylococcus aureus]
TYNRSQRTRDWNVRVGIRLTDNDKNNIDKILNNYFENKSVIIKENTKTLRDKNENWEQLVKLSDYIDDKLDKKN